MSPTTVHCPQCRAELPGDALNRAELTACTACNTDLLVEAYPALFRGSRPGQAGEIATLDGEATCFYHPQKRAILVCEGCGRFVCGLCDCDLHGKHFCPACLEAGKTKGKIKNLENARTLHDSVALSLAVLPLLIFYFTIITAPMTLVMVVRHWNAPGSVLGRGKGRFVAAFVIALLEIAAWVVFFCFLAFGRVRNG